MLQVAALRVDGTEQPKTITVQKTAWIRATIRYPDAARVTLARLDASKRPSRFIGIPKHLLTGV